EPGTDLAGPGRRSSDDRTGSLSGGAGSAGGVRRSVRRIVQHTGPTSRLPRVRAGTPIAPRPELQVVSVSGSLGVSQEAQADECPGEVQECPDRGALPVVALAELAEGNDPGLRSLHHPAMPSQPLTRLHATSRDPWDNPALAQRPSLFWEVVLFVRVQLGRAL